MHARVPGANRRAACPIGSGGAVGRGCAWRARRYFEIGQRHIEMPKPPGGKACGKGGPPTRLSPAAGGHRCNFEGALIFPTAEQDQGEISPERGSIGGRHAARAFHLAQCHFQLAITHQIPEPPVQGRISDKTLFRGFAFFRGGAGILPKAFLHGRSRQAGPAGRGSAQ